jgi:hypothetical protein
MFILRNKGFHERLAVGSAPAPANAKAPIDQVEDMKI